MSHFKVRFDIQLIIATIFCGASQTLIAQPMVDDDIYFEELPVVLTASRLLQPLSEAPSAMTVIDRAMIRATGARSIAEVFRLVPGMYVGYADGNTPIVSLRNNSDQYARRMQVLIDGRSIYLAPTGGVDWAELPFFLDDIERIEVVRGPSAASHGANSLFGVINIITRDAASQNGGQISIHKGQFGISDASASMGKIGEDFEFRLSAGYRAEQESGFRSHDAYMSLPTAQTNRYQFNSATQVLHDGSNFELANLRANYHPSAMNSFDLQAGFSQGYRQTGTLGRIQEPFRNIYIETDFSKLEWQHVYADSDESKLVFSRTYRRLSDSAMPVYPSGISAPITWNTFRLEEARIARHELEIQNSVHLGEQHRVVFGGGVRHDYADYYNVIGLPRSVVQYRIFGHEEWRITESMLLNIGNMSETDGMGNVSHSPRTSLNYHITPEHTLRVGYSTAVRNPVLGEWYLGAGPTSSSLYLGKDHTPSQNLEPERIVSKEIAWLADMRPYRFSFEVRGFIDQVAGIVSDNMASLSPYALNFRNNLKEEIKGVEGSIKYFWDHGFITAGYAWQTIQCGFQLEPSFYSIGAVQQYFLESWLQTCPQSVPRHSGSILASHNITDHWHVSSALYMRTQVRINNVAPINEYPPESTMRRLDLRIARSFGEANQPGGGEIALSIENANLDSYTINGNVPERRNLYAPRRGYLSVTTYF